MSPLLWTLLALAPLGVEGLVLPPLEEMPAEIRQHVEEAVADLQDLAAADPQAFDPQEAADRYGEAGRVFHAYRLLEPARHCYEEALRRAPDATRWLYHLALTHQSAGDLEQAERLLRQVLALDPAHPAAELRLGQVLLDQGRGVEAEALFRGVLAAQPALPFALAGLGQALALRQWHEEALEPLEQALLLVPEAHSLHHAIGMAYRALGEAEQARFHLERGGPARIGVPDPATEALAALVRSALPAYQRGLEAARAGHFEEAARQLSRALELDPEHVPSMVNLATALAELGDPAGARDHLERALALDPEHSLARFNLGALLVRFGDPDAAIPHLEAAAADPEDEEARQHLAFALELAGRPQEALEQYGALLDRNPRLLTARLGEARALEEVGRYREALERLRIARDLAPEAPEAALGLARLLAASGDPELRDGAGALELAQELFEEAPTGLHAETVALALAELGRCREAEGWQREALARAALEGAHPRSLGRLLDGIERYLAPEEGCRLPAAAAVGGHLPRAPRNGD